MVLREDVGVALDARLRPAALIVPARLLLEQVGDFVQPPGLQPVEPTLLATDHGNHRTLPAPDLRNERRKIELASDLHFVGHRLAEPDRLPQVVEPRAEHGVAAGAVTLELLVEELPDALEVRLQSHALLMRLLGNVTSLLAFVEQRVHPRLFVAWRRRHAGIEVDEEADRAALLGAEARELPERVPGHAAGHEGRFYVGMRCYTAGHGTRTSDDLVQMLRKADVQTLVDVRRYPGSRRNPQFNQGVLASALATAGIRYTHAEALGGRLSGEPGEERFGCIRTAAFRSYAARMGTPEWQQALAGGARGAGSLLPLRRDELAPLPPQADRGRARRTEVRSAASASGRRGATSSLGRRRGARRTALPLRRARRLTRQAREVDRPADAFGDAPLDVSLERGHLLGITRDEPARNVPGEDVGGIERAGRERQVSADRANLTRLSETGRAERPDRIGAAEPLEPEDALPRAGESGRAAAERPPLPSTTHRAREPLTRRQARGLDGHRPRPGSGPHERPERRAGQANLAGARRNRAHSARAPRRELGFPAPDAARRPRAVRLGRLTPRERPGLRQRGGQRDLEDRLSRRRGVCSTRHCEQARE